MNLLNIYNALQSDEISFDDAAAKFGTTPVGLRIRLVKNGTQLPLVLATLDRIGEGKMTRDEAVTLLGVGKRHVNQLQKSWSIKRPICPRVVHCAAVKIKWEINKKYAIDFIADDTGLDNAAEKTDLSTRQVRRWVSNLLKKHYEMTYKELKSLTLDKRRRLADEIDVAEHLESAKQQVLQSIAEGKLAIEAEALKRVLSKRTTAHRKPKSA